MSSFFEGYLQDELEELNNEYIEDDEANTSKKFSARFLANFI